MKKIRTILSVPFLLLGVFFKMLGLRVLHPSHREEARDLF
jgi:hypothetical protein